MPKKSIISALENRYSSSELDAVRPEIYDLLQSCQTLNQLHEELVEILKRKQLKYGSKRTSEANLLGV